ncbi:MAG: hypothetical protein ACYC0E_16045, partial [Acidimicrobiales bacterium]
MAAPLLWLFPSSSAGPGTPALAAAAHPPSVTVLAAAVGGAVVAVVVGLVAGSRLRRGHRHRLARQSDLLLTLLPPDGWDPAAVPGHPAVASVAAEPPSVRLVGA